MTVELLLAEALRLLTETWSTDIRIERNPDVRPIPPFTPDASVVCWPCKDMDALFIYANNKLIAALGLRKDSFIYGSTYNPYNGWGGNHDWSANEAMTSLMVALHPYKKEVPHAT